MGRARAKGKAAPGGWRRVVLAGSALALLGSCATVVGPGGPRGAELVVFRMHLRQAERLAYGTGESLDGKIAAARHVRAALGIAERQGAELVRRSMLSELFESVYRADPSLWAPSGDLPRGYVPVLAVDCDTGLSPRIAAVPVASFYLDGAGRPVGFRGPRVLVQLADFVAQDEGQVPTPFHEPRPDDRGAFVDTSNPVAAGVGTAFVVACEVIEQAGGWAAREIRWGQDGQLKIVTYESVATRLQCLFDCEAREVRLGVSGRLGADGTLRDVLVDAARSRDAVAHECGHAVVAALKPGFYAGIAVALSEALADMMACLVALGDPVVATRVLTETRGELRRDNEASRICEAVGKARSAPQGGKPAGYLRSVATSTGLGVLGLASDTVALPSPAVDAVVGLDPHRVSQAISGALYEVLVGLYEELSRQGVPRAEALESSRDEVGSLMLRALAYVGEHSPSPHDYAMALVRVDEEQNRGHARRALRAALYARNLLDPLDDLEAELEAGRSWLPRFRLAPGADAQSELLARIPELETLPPARADLPPRVAYARLWAVVALPGVIRSIRRSAAFGLKWLAGDVTSRDGTRLVRFSLPAEDTVSGRPPPPIAGSAGTGPGAAICSAAGRPGRYASLVFDAEGWLTALHVDEPAIE